MTEYAGLPLTIKRHPRAKRVLLKIVPGKGLEIVTPTGYPDHLVPDVLEEKQSWIRRTRDRLLAEGHDLSGRPPSLPETMDYRAIGRTIRLDYINRPMPVRLTENAARVQVVGPREDRHALLEALQKYTARKARGILLPLLDAMSRKTGLKYESLRIRRQKTRWGSCSARGTISLNAKLLFLPPELVEHLILHELCHTRYLNHSKQYWACVASYQPDYKRLEDEVRHGNKYVPQWFS